MIDRLSNCPGGSWGFSWTTKGGWILLPKTAKKTHLVKTKTTLKPAQVDGDEQEWETVDTDVEFYSAHEALRDLCQKHALSEKSRVEDYAYRFDLTCSARARSPLGGL